MVNIRKMDLKDVNEVSILEEKSFSMPWSAQSFITMLGEKDTLYLVAEEKDLIIGCCGVTNIVGEGSINNVVVDENQRGRGIATKLLTELIKRGEKIGIHEFTLEVRRSNATAIHLYEKIGFQSEGIRPRFYEKPIEDAIIMWKRQ